MRVVQWVSRARDAAVAALTVAVAALAVAGTARRPKNVAPPLEKKKFRPKCSSGTGRVWMEPSEEPSDGGRVVVWLQDSLRVSDNEALRRGAAAAHRSLSVVFVWRHGDKPRTPSDVFECAAATQLRAELAALGNDLAVLHTDDCDAAAARAVAHLALSLSASLLVVDASKRGGAEALDLESALGASSGGRLRVEAVTDDSLLLPFATSHRALGRSRFGGKTMRWAAFLPVAGAHEQALPKPPPTRLPQAPREQESVTQALPLPESAGNWARRLLSSWGEINEARALQLASDAMAPADTDLGERPRVDTEIGERPRVDEARAQVDKGLFAQVDHAHPRPSRLSPYLRWGVISPREAVAAGVRKRHLLWRDWSYLCWRLMPSMREGNAVLHMLDDVCVSDRCALGDQPLWESTEDAFAAWCVGQTGAPLVDAAMRQLWYEGWMPRWARILSAACLTEGLGVSWRRGRDWFAHTLIDHDPAINECMWQNAGLCGVDAFYAAARWEEAPSADTVEYVQLWLAAELRWPPSLRAAASRPRPSESALASLALRRRAELSNVYRAVRRVSWIGLRVNPNGEVIRIGRELIGESRALAQFAQAKMQPSCVQ